MKQKIRSVFLPLVDRLRMIKRKALSRFRTTPVTLSPLPPQKGGSHAVIAGKQSSSDSEQSSLGSTTPRSSQVPLFLQIDKQWKDIPYGTDGSRTMEENGCAIATLAMIGNHYGLGLTPETVQAWARNDYYVYLIGTTWDIFADFALWSGLQFRNLENDIDSAIEELEQGHLVVVSVKPGKFTDIGHIMLLTGYKDGKFSINDPNDDGSKANNYCWFDAELVAEDSLNFWSYSLKQ